MAIMIPAKMPKEALDDPKLGGERLVFDMFSDPEIPGYVFYSVRQNNHLYKLSAEIDFLYLCDRGMICIEVKGGQRIGRGNGEWYSVDKNDISHVIKDPFNQANGCKYALEKLLTKEFGVNSPERRTLIGYAVVFPECIFTGKGNDLLTECMYDCDENRNSSFSAFLKKVFQYWYDVYKTKCNYEPQKLTASQISKIKNLVRGDFETIPSGNLILQRLERTFLRLTEEQYSVLDYLEANKSVLVEGAAGTGKTILAMELLRREVSQGRKVLMLCFNKNLAQYIKDSVIDVNGTFDIATFHSFAKDIVGKEYIDEVSPVEISNQIRDKVNDLNKYDVLIVDEAQDLMYLDTLEIFDMLVNGGLRDGRWIFFLDGNQNIFGKEQEFDDVIGCIDSGYHPAHIPLTVNCRNTGNIAIHTAILTDTKTAKILGDNGPDVYKCFYSDREEFYKQFVQKINSALTSGVSPKDIVILSKYRKCNSLLSKYDKICNLKLAERHDVFESRNDSISYYTIQSFKGLESKYVFLVDIDGLDDIHDRKLNYIGASRAKYVLYMFVDEKLRNNYEKLCEEWMIKSL